MGYYYLCYTFKLTLTFIHTLKVTTECTNALPLKLRKNQRDGATTAASAALGGGFTLATLYSIENQKEVTYLK